MSRVFVDTSALVALFNEDDTLYDKAVKGLEMIKSRRLRVVISDFVFSETVTTALARAGHRTAVTVGEFILSSAIVDFIWLDEAQKRRAWDYFKRHDDKRFSFTDCTSFVLMDELKIKRYFGFDEDFKRAGFISVS